jgi:uncharacterized protein (TIGR00251 family)
VFYNIYENRITLRIKAQPNASRSEFAQVMDEAIKVRIKAPAVEGAANKELLRFLSKSFKVAKSDIVFKSGERSKIKIVEFPISEVFINWSREYEE